MTDGGRLEGEVRELARRVEELEVLVKAAGEQLQRMSRAFFVVVAGLGRPLGVPSVAAGRRVVMPVPTNFSVEFTDGPAVGSVVVSHGFKNGKVL
jgi:hypothetical protein